MYALEMEIVLVWTPVIAPVDMLEVHARYQSALVVMKQTHWYVVSTELAPHQTLARAPLDTMDLSAMSTIVKVLCSVMLRCVLEMDNV